MSVLGESVRVRVRVRVRVHVRVRVYVCVRVWSCMPTSFITHSIIIIIIIMSLHNMRKYYSTDGRVCQLLA